MKTPTNRQRIPGRSARRGVQPAVLATFLLAAVLAILLAAGCSDSQETQQALEPVLQS